MWTGPLPDSSRGIEMLHPDKGSEMCLYELSVGEPFRRGGIGRALTEALAAEARQRGCYVAWVGVEQDDEAQLASVDGRWCARPVPEWAGAGVRDGARGSHGPYAPG